MLKSDFRMRLLMPPARKNKKPKNKKNKKTENPRSGRRRHSHLVVVSVGVAALARLVIIVIGGGAASRRPPALDPWRGREAGRRIRPSPLPPDSCGDGRRPPIVARPAAYRIRRPRALVSAREGRGGEEPRAARRACARGRLPTSARRR